MVMALERARTEAIHELHNELNYFLREYDIAEDLEKAVDLKKLVERGNAEAALKSAQNYLKLLKKFEFREQLWASADKIRVKLDDFLKAVHTDPRFAGIKKRIETLITKLKVFEGKLMVDTAKRLRPEIEGKKANEVDWRKVMSISKEILDALRALVILNKQLTKTIGG
ncbi:MAG: hypothetical protein AABX74_04165 [Nanoarchaeota archaeon]